MKHLNYCIVVMITLSGFAGTAYSSTAIPANNPYIQYYGRWDFSTPTAPTHSWPGVYIYAKFEGTSIGISTNDNFSYYNVFIDDTTFIDFHGTNSGVSSYTLKTGLKDTVHTILITLRNETNWTKFSFNGFILDNGKTLLPPPAEPTKGIEFIGDSFTCASGNLWTDNNAAPSGDWSDLYEGFPAMIARHYGAQYVVTAHSGWGLVHDYVTPNPSYANNLPSIFGSMVSYATTPAWNFSQWQPNLVIICLGLNDYSGWDGYNTNSISPENTATFKDKYHQFISTIMDVYPYTKILAVAANGIPWLQNTISQIVSEENAMGHTNVSYSYFPYYNGGYVNAGHPNVASHQKIADTLIATIDTINVWTPFTETRVPDIVSSPSSPFIITTSTYALTVKTSEYDTVRYSTEDKPFEQMENQFSITGTRAHSTLLTCQPGQQYTYYLRARDAYGNVMDTSAVINFSVDTSKALLAWNASSAYDLSSWKLGKAPLGNDNAPGDSTKVSPATTVYFRQTVTLSDVSTIHDFRVFVKGHDGAVAYVNGKEIGRVNVDPNADVSYNTFALAPMTLNTSIIMSNQDRATYLKNGKNVVAVEVHSRNTTVPDMSFDAIVINNYGSTYIDLGQEWYYYDKGDVPAGQLVDKSTLSVAQNNGLLPGQMALYTNYPNPFNPTTTISFDLSKKGRVELKVFNVLGQLVETLVNGELNPGKYSYKFDGNRLASGIYFYQLKAATFTDIKKMVLIK